MHGEIEPPPFDFERYRKRVLHFGDFVTVPPVVVDNSGGVAPSVLTAPVIRLSTGAIGINKTQDYSYGVAPVGAAGTADAFSTPTDGGNAGFWRRVLILDCFVYFQGFAGTPSPGTIGGIELGSYGAIPPNPALSNNNVVRLYLRADTFGWELRVHRGDGATAASVTPLVGEPSAAVARAQHARIVYSPSQYVRGYVDGVLGAEVTTGLPTLSPIGNPSSCGIFVEAGATTNAQIRCAYWGMTLELRGFA